MKVRYSFKLTALILTMAMLSGLAASCGSDSGNNELPVDTTDSETTTEAPEPDPIEKLGTHDFGGKEYVILSTNEGYGSQPHYDFEFLVEEANGEVINDAVYNRQVKIEDLYNVKLVNETATGSEVCQRVANAVLAGDTSYSLVCAPLHAITSTATGGYLANYYDFDAIDLYQPWWNQNATESLTINGKCFLQTNFIQSASALAAHCLFYNKDIADQYNVEDIYSMVLDGTWTLDKLIEISENVSTDLNGDTVYDDQDLYGFMGSFGAIGIFHYGCDNPFLNISDDGVVTHALQTERLQTTIDKLYKLCYEGNSAYARPISEESKLAQMFANSQSLFYTGFFFDMISTFRDMKDDFGLLPYPKFDEAQDGYYTAIHGSAPLLGIPLVVEDPEMVGVVTEALAIESYNTVRPALVDLTLRNKLLRDEQSMQIYDLFFDGIKVELALVYRSTNAVFEAIYNILSSKSSDLSSYISSRMPAAVASYQKIIDAFMED